MKKIISVILSVTMLCGILYIPLTAGASGLSTGTRPVFDPNYTAVFNDFEDESLRTFSHWSGAFSFVDTDNEKYGYAFRIAADTWRAMTNSNTTYTFNGNTYTLFNEAVTIGKHYIMSYDYKNIAETFSSSEPVSFAPQHENFKTTSGDYRDHIPYYNNTTWYKHSVGFTAGKNTMDLKINTCSGAGAYIDNLLVVEAAEFKDLTDNSATIEVSEGEIVTNNKNGISNMVAKGNKLSFKVNVANSFYKAVVTHGDTPVTPVNGVYTIDKVTADIEVKTEIDKDVLDGVVKAKFSVDSSNNITFSAGDTLAKFMDETKIVESLISLKNGENDVARDEALKDGYVLNIVDSGETIVSYTVKIDGTVDNYTPDSAKTAIIDSYISNTINKSGTGIGDTNLENSVLYNGNRSAVANVIKKAMKGEKVTIVAFGGSITWGAGESSVPSSITHSFSGNENYVKLVGDWFKSVFGDNVTIRNAGIGATDTPYAIHRMNMDVMSFDPDLVIVEWDKNDVNKDTYKQATYENMLRKFISKGVAVVMFGMCGSNTNGDDSSIEMHIPLAEKYDLPYISYRDAFGDKTNSYKSDLLTKLTNDNVHPNIVGHQLAALLLNNYFGNIYKNIASIGSYEPVMPEEPYNEEATVFGEGRVVDLDDVAEGKVEGVRIVDLGSFVKDTTLYNPGREDISKNHERYAYKAQYSQSYEPMVIEIDNCYSLHLLLLRVNRTDGTFKVFVNDNEVTDPKGSFTSGTASDNTQIESTYAWASSRVCLNNDPTKITLKILPTNKDPQSYVGLYGLLLADAPVTDEIVVNDGKVIVDSGEERDLFDRSTANNHPTWSKNKDTLKGNAVVYQEPVVFYTDSLGTDRTVAKLMYPIENIVAVTSYSTVDGEFVQYYEDKDFTITADGKIALTEDTTIPRNFALNEMKTGIANSNGGISIWNGAGKWSKELPQNQILVTYTHTKSWSNVDYSIPTYYNGLSAIYKKLDRGDNLDVLFIGDSISTGCNASGQDGVFYTYRSDAVGGTTTIKGWSSYLGLGTEPYWVNDSWDKQVVANLKAAYPDATINATNRSVGSSASKWYFDHIDELLVTGSLGDVGLENTDLVFIAFGMNEGNNTASTQNANIKKIIDYLRQKNPDVSVVLVSAFYPTFWDSNNRKWTNNRLGEQEDGYFALVNEYDNIAVAPVNTAFKNVLGAKEPVDYIANGINHPNDYAVNLYADTITATILGCTHKNTTVHQANPSTCKVQGNNEYTTCDDCGAVISGSNAKLPLADHNYIEKAEAKYLKSAATCTSKAVYYKSCSACGEKSAQTFKYGDFDYLNHTGASYLMNQKKATYYETGYTGDSYCRNCNKKVKSGTVIPKLTVSSVSVKTNPTKTTYYVGDSLNTSGLVLTVKFSDNSTSTVTSGFTTSGFSSASVGTKTVTVTFGGKTAKFTVKVVKRNASKPATPVLSSKSSTTVTLKKVTGCQYSKDGKNWQSSNVFTGLTANTTYTFYQRVAETSKNHASSASSGLKVKTNPKETLVKQNGIWYYTVNDKKVTATTLCKYGSTWIYVKNGVKSTSNTLVKYKGIWYHVKNGTIAKDTTLVKYGGTWYYVKGGKLSNDNTLVKYNGVWYHVKNGTIAKDTTLVKYGNTWYYVKNGVMNKSNTLVKYGNTWYHVKNGTLAKDTTLVKYNGKWYYVQKGIVNFKANTKVKYNGKWYTVRNGVVK